MIFESARGRAVQRGFHFGDVPSFINSIWRWSYKLECSEHDVLSKYNLSRKLSFVEDAEPLLVVLAPNTR